MTGKMDILPWKPGQQAIDDVPHSTFDDVVVRPEGMSYILQQFCSWVLEQLFWRARIYTGEQR